MNNRLAEYFAFCKQTENAVKDPDCVAPLIEIFHSENSNDHSTTTA